MPFPVKHLLKGQTKLITVSKDTLAVDAFNLMIENDFSQLPVIDDENHALGMVTHESVLRGIRNFQSAMDRLRVRDVMINAPIFNMEDDLFDLMDQLKNTNAVLIIDPGNEIGGIVTSYDATEYFRKRTENLMRVEDIESTIKEFIRLSYSNSDGDVDNEKLSTIISTVFASKPFVKNKNFDQLSLGEYIQLLLCDDTWQVVQTIFGIDKDSLRNLLDEIRKTRNDLAHFRSEITSYKQDQLKFCVTWISRRQEEWEMAREKAFNEEMIRKHQSIAQSTEPTSVSIESETRQEKNVLQQDGPKDSRYAPLADFLLGQSGQVSQIKKSFEEVEEIIGGALPASARNHRAWWANDTIGHPHAKSWLDAGWRTSYLNMTDQHVTFARIREREKAYIDFFSVLLADLSKYPEFPLKKVSPDGASWIVVADLPNPGPALAFFTFSFTRDRRLRVELYLDGYDQVQTKRLFDLIYEKHQQYEEQLGAISWERIDEKKASRIALYHPGQITDKKEKLDEVRAWAVEMMPKFYNVLAPDVEQRAAEVMKR